MQVRELGTIRSYLPDRGFGFLIPENADRELFFHAKACDVDEEKLTPGLRVSFRIVADLRRPGSFRAVDVAELDAAGEV